MTKKHVFIGGLVVAAMMVASSMAEACPCGADGKMGGKTGGWEYLAKRMKAPRKGKWLNRWNEMGSQGWKLVSTSENVYVFMRPATVGWADSSTVTESTMPAAIEAAVAPAATDVASEPVMTKADKKAEKDAKKAADKADKEAKKAEKDQIKAEKKAKDEALKAQKKAEKEAAKAAKEAEEAAKKAESSN